MAIFKFDTRGDVKDAFTSIAKSMEEAASGAISDAASILKTKVRADIAAAGFGPKWQSALRVNTYPAKPSMGAALFLFHRIPYSDVFEEGATIRGKPLLWLPLHDAPKGASGRAISARQLIATHAGGYTGLIPVRRAGRAPLLFGVTADKKRSPKPLYVGISSVTIRKKFHVASITQEVANQLPDLYSKNLKG